MTDESMREKKAWSLVQGGMEESDSAQMAGPLEGDPVLKKELEDVELAHQYYRTLIPLMDVSREELERKIIHSWEASLDETVEQQPSHPKPAAHTKPVPRFPTRMLLGLAACLTLLLGVYYNLDRPASIRWETELTPLLRRGVNEDKAPSLLYQRSGEKPGSAIFPPPAGESRSPVPAPYSDEELKALSEQLREAVLHSYEPSLSEPRWKFWIPRKPHWTLRVRLHELDDGILQLEAGAFTTASDAPVWQWAELFDSAKAFREQAEGVGHYLAMELLALRQARPAPPPSPRE